MPGGRSHHSIVSFYEIYEVDSQFQLVMEYVDGKNAHDWVGGARGAAADRQRRDDRPALAAGARLRPFEGLRPSRREAVEPADLRPGAPAAREADRLRPRQELRRDRGPDDR